MLDNNNYNSKKWLLILSILIFSSGCDSWIPDEDPMPERMKEEVSYDYSFMGSVLGDGGLSVFGEGEKSGEGGGGIGVNSFLWRATLDTIAFMPVSTADAFGGVILTDWHSPSETKNERFKLNVYILGRTLRADGVRVAVFRQTKASNGAWRDDNVDNEAGVKIENAILTRARMLRHATLTKE